MAAANCTTLPRQDPTDASRAPVCRASVYRTRLCFIRLSMAIGVALQLVFVMCREGMRGSEGTATAQIRNIVSSDVCSRTAGRLSCV
eukprot:3934720-Rhodomonas_salina.1